ncbi:MAG TPA: lipase family protein [Candidatus Corynebacterium avicola]|uniref:Lipase family protein n=1 Tax=Candidatus Corynebacterium avicola TaxID=2838527 RepID=A0A9D1UKT4_9CORY|nr:lipase family protein [Candidatus Corynebacterium avicola]
MKPLKTRMSQAVLTFAATSALAISSTAVAVADETPGSPDPDASGSVLSGESVLPGVDVPPFSGESNADGSDPFYLPPENLPSETGEVLRTQDAPQLLNLASDGGPGSAEKILYNTVNEHDEPVAASGVVLKPTGKWQGKGPAPTIVATPGTRGAGDICAPSRSSNQLFGFDDGNGAVNLNYEYPFHAAASAMGMNVIVVDLIGLGTPGQHTYVNHLEEGTATLDGARAGLTQLGLPQDSPLGFFGYSQGGGASAAAAERAQDYAPELNVKGTFAGAPPADLTEVVDYVDDHAITGVIGFALNGALARHPELAGLQDEYFNEKGKRFMEDTKDRCIGDVVGRWAFTDTRTMTKSGKSFGEIAREDERLQEVLESYKLANRYKDLNAPMLVVNGKNDDTIPWQQARDAADRYCEAGGDVQFNTDPLPSVLPGSVINHAVPMLTQAGGAFNYLVDRFNDKPAPSNCGEF